MSALNLKPQNPLTLVLLAGGALWLLTRRTYAQAPAPGITTRQLSGPGNGFQGGLASALNALSGWLRPSRETATQTVAREAGAAAVKAGDPYYGGDDSINGTSADWWSQQLIEDALAWQRQNGDAAAATGDPYAY